MFRPWMWIPIAFFAFLILGFLLGTRVYSGCTGPTSGWTTCAFYDVAKDFKEVFGWIIAVCAAYMAARPVWQQLDLMRVDNDISSVKFLEQEIEALKRLRTDVQNALNPLHGYIQSHSQIDEGFAWEGNAHAAHQAARIAGESDRDIRGNGSFEEAVEQPRRDLIGTLWRLQSCFNEMHIATDIEFDEEISDAQLNDAREAERSAAATIDRRIADFDAAYSRFGKSINNAIADRTRLISEKKTAMVSSR